MSDEHETHGERLERGASETDVAVSTFKHTEGPWFDWAEREWIRTPENLLSNFEDACLIAVAPELKALADAGYKLSTYTAAIRWSDQECNTQEWLDGLKERIEVYQEAYTALMAVLDSATQGVE